MSHAYFIITFNLFILGLILSCLLLVQFYLSRMDMNRILWSIKANRLYFFFNGYELQSFHRAEGGQNFRCGVMCLAEIAGRPKALNHCVTKLSSLIHPEPIIAQSDVCVYTFMCIYFCIHTYIYTNTYIYARTSAGDWDFCTQISKWVIFKEVASEPSAQSWWKPANGRPLMLH